MQPNIARQVIPSVEPIPAPHEKRMAALMHVAAIFAPIWGPLVGAAVAGRSRYVRAHALQALYETLLLNLLLGVAMVCSLIYSISRLWYHYQTDWQHFSWTEFLLRFAIGWLILGLLALINAVLSIRAAVKANAGVWPKRARVVKRLTS